MTHSMRDDDSSDPPKLVQMVPPSPVDSPPPSVDMEVGFGALSRQGPGRSVNDDHYLIMRLGRHLEMLKTSLPDGDLPRHFDEYGYGMVVADGMGGAGDLASRLAKLQDASLSAASAGVGKGATFTLRIPGADRSDEA